MKNSPRLLFISCQSNLNVIGLKYLHSFCLSKGYTSSILFAPTLAREGVSLDKAFENIWRFIKKTEPDIIGVSLMTPEFLLARDLTVYLRERTSTPIIWGGIDSTVEPRRSMEYADAVCIGEAENVIEGLLSFILEDAPERDLRSVVYKDKTTGAIKEAPLQQYTGVGLDSLPFPEHVPSHSYVLDEEYAVVEVDAAKYAHFDRYKGKFLSLTTSRGCPFHCSYCCNDAFRRLFGSATFRRRSVEGTLEELDFLMAKHPDSVMTIIEDDCFIAHDLKWIRTFSDYHMNKGIPLLMSANPKLVTEEKLTMLKETKKLGFVRIGIQSGSERVNKEIYNRKTSQKDVLAAARLLNKYKVAFYVDIILDNPYEKREDLLETVSLLKKLPKPFHIQFFSLTMYPGTSIRERALGDNIKFEDPCIKNFVDYMDAPLNHIIRMSKIYPKSFINLLLAMEAGWGGVGKAMIRFVIYLSIPLELLNLSFITWRGCNGSVSFFLKFLNVAVSTNIRKILRFK
jgi:anaerobic magnesium-protoporphyrin IX monomethyl ester cyclase